MRRLDDLIGTHAEPGSRIRGVVAFSRLLGRLVALLAVLCSTSWPLLVSGNTLINAWAGVQQTLSAGESQRLESSLRNLLGEVRGLGIRRATPLAEALTAGAEDRPDEMAMMLLQASKRLDPVLPAPRFQAAKLKWRHGARIEAVGEFATGFVNLFRHEPTRRGIIISVVPWIVLTMGLVIVAAVLVQICRFIRLIGNDGFFLGSILFSRLNAVIFACVGLTLPLFAGLGPAWALVFLFSLTWIYMSMSQRIVAVASLVLLAVLTPVLEIWKEVALRPLELESRVERMLVLRSIDFSTLREFNDLGASLEHSAAYHVLVGELLRTHGDRELARVHFEKAMREAPNAEVPRLFLGVLALEDRDPFRAQELFQEAVETNPGSVLGYYNLAIALDLTRRFDEGDASRRRARELAGRDFTSVGLPGREDRMLYPRLSGRMVQRVVDDAPERVRVILTGGATTALSWSRMLAPLTVVSIFGLIFGGAVLFVRTRWFEPSQECVKCGKVFRPEDNTVYCGQCVSVFLKRNAVSIEQQSSKTLQVRRWNALASSFRRLAGILVPGGSYVAEGRSLLGSMLAFLVWLPIVGAVFWIPLYLAHVAPTAPLLTLQLVMVTVALIGWVVLAVSAWNRR